MAEGRGRSDWDHTAALQAQIANILRDKGKPAVKPTDLNPFRRSEKKTPRMTMAQLKEQFGPMLGRVDPPA